MGVFFSKTHHYWSETIDFAVISSFPLSSLAKKKVLSFFLSCSPPPSSLTFSPSSSGRRNGGHGWLSHKFWPPRLQPQRRPSLSEWMGGWVDGWSVGGLYSFFSLPTTSSSLDSPLAFSFVSGPTKRESKTITCGTIKYFLRSAPRRLFGLHCQKRTTTIP